MLHTHALADPKHCGVGWLGKHVGLVSFGISWGHGAGWKREAGLGILFGCATQAISLCPRWGKFLSPRKEMSRLEAQKGRKTDGASIRNALEWGHSSGPSRNPFILGILTKGLCPRHV